jgi:hypothetical protein
VSKTVDAETYLRLACERELLSGESQGSLGGLFVVGRALIAAGSLEEDMVRDVLGDYGFAASLRGSHHMWHMGLQRHSDEAVPLAVRRVVSCDLEFENGGEEATLTRIVFQAEGTKLSLVGIGTRTPARRLPLHAGMRAAFMRQHMVMGQRGPMTVRDDRGTTATASPNGRGSSGGEWHQDFETDIAMSPETAWIEIDGVRLDLPPPSAAAAVHREPVEPVDPVQRMLFAEVLAGTDMHRGGGGVDAAIEALCATGALEKTAPLLSDVRVLATSFENGRRAGALPPPWDAVFRRIGRHDGPTFKLPIVASVEGLDEFTLLLESLESGDEFFSVEIVMSPAWPLFDRFPHQSGLDAPPIEWWADDDRDNVYVLSASSHGGSHEYAEGQLYSMAPIDPKAKVLRLLPTVSSERAVVTVPLTGTAGARP